MAKRKEAPKAKVGKVAAKSFRQAEQAMAKAFAPPAKKQTIEVKKAPKPADVHLPAKMEVVSANPAHILINYEGGVPLVNSTVPGILEITMLRKVP